MSDLAAFLFPVALVALVVIAIARALSPPRAKRICKEFGLDPKTHKLLGDDLGQKRGRIFLRADGVVGVPDAVFRDTAHDSLVIGEAKSRRFRGHIKDYERFQLILYMGASRRKFRNASVAGVFRFGCGSTIAMPFDEAVYRELIALIPRYKAALSARPK